ncbi:alpha/beta fold hydrolase [Kitasatospora sp. NPDC049285]|uniref:thioesterase II family protein n=1 Tax=Kitasatospora sp. NPDC049285 TaxID=3157096 RepID=UPI0034202505
MTSTVSTADLWIRRYATAEPGAPKLVCLPHAGGSATFYVPMARALAPHCEVLAVQYPGRQDRLAEPRLESLDALADRIVPLLLPYAEDGLALFGHSMGATLAFEVARLLEEAGAVPLALFASGRAAPSRLPAGGTVHQGTDAELAARLRVLGGTYAPVLDDPELLELTLPAVRSDYKAAETYRYRPGAPLTCPVHVLTGDQDPMVTDADARAWAEHTSGPFALDTYAGGHFFLAHHQAPILASVTARLSRA